MRPYLSLAFLALLASQGHSQLTLPYLGTDSTATLSSFQITKSGTSGRANTLYITNASNTSDALLVNTVGTGRGGYFSISNTASTQPALRGDSNGAGVGVFGFMTGTGRAGSFRITNTSNTNSALLAQTDGSGPALRATSGTGLAGDFDGDTRITGNATNALEVIGGATISSQVVAASFVGVGTQLTNLSGNNITTGTVADARLSSNIARTNANNLWGGTQRFPAASASFPGVAIGADNAGFFRSNSGIGFATSGFERMTLSSSGKLGFGTNSALAKLHLKDGDFPSAAIAANMGILLEAADNDGTGIQFLSQNARLLYGLSNSATRQSIVFSGQQNRMEFQMGNLPVAIAIDGATNFTAIKKGINAPTTALDVTGTITGSAKNFLIDHPQDPLNKTLRHACIESDEYKNIYDGTVMTNAQGVAMVNLPDWFDSVNENFRYQLTVIDDGDEFVLAKVTREIANNAFTLRTSKPNVKVSWMVTGVRKDVYVRENPLVIEELKPKKERGSLLYQPVSSANRSKGY